MLTRQLSLLASKRWPVLSLNNLRSCQLTTAYTINTPKLAPSAKRHCAIQAAASTAAESDTPASFVLSAARELADAGVSAAGLATYAEKPTGIDTKLVFAASTFAISCGSWVDGLLSISMSARPVYVCARIPCLLRCRILGISGNNANPLADCLLSFGALSVR